MSGNLWASLAVVLQHIHSGSKEEANQMQTRGEWENQKQHVHSRECDSTFRRSEMLTQDATQMNTQTW